MRREGEAAALGLDTSKQTEDALSVHAPLAVAAWKGKGSINILVSKGKCAKVSGASGHLVHHVAFARRS